MTAKDSDTLCSLLHWRVVEPSLSFQKYNTERVRFWTSAVYITYSTHIYIYIILRWIQRKETRKQYSEHVQLLIVTNISLVTMKSMKQQLPRVSSFLVLCPFCALVRLHYSALCSTFCAVQYQKRRRWKSPSSFLLHIPPDPQLPCHICIFPGVLSRPNTELKCSYYLWTSKSLIIALIIYAFDIWLGISPSGSC